MAQKKEVEEQEVNNYEYKYKYAKKNVSGGDGVYGLGIIGAAVFYLQHAHTFMDGLIGIAKAIFWPALLVYKLIQMLKF
jgi:hypothetical protein